MSSEQQAVPKNNLRVEKSDILTDGLTSREIALAMLKDIEHRRNTGPIIGDAREVIIDLCFGIFHRDQLIMALTKMTNEKYTQVLISTGQHLADKDAEIMAKRGEARP